MARDGCNHEPACRTWGECLEKQGVTNIPDDCYDDPMCSCGQPGFACDCHNDRDTDAEEDYEEQHGAHCLCEDCQQDHPERACLEGSCDGCLSYPCSAVEVTPMVPEDEA